MKKKSYRNLFSKPNNHVDVKIEVKNELLIEN